VHEKPPEILVSPPVAVAAATLLGPPILQIHPQPALPQFVEQKPAATKQQYEEAPV
jgi:hypothetical protein